jgi:hypothetical protein
MKKHLVILLLCTGYIAAQAQSGKPFITLQPGEKVIPLYSCMWLNAKNEFYRLVIGQAGDKYSVITEGERKDNLSYKEMYSYITAFNCDEKDPHKPRKSTRYAGAKLVKINTNGKYVITSGKKTYGPYEEIIHISELGEKFVAVVRVLKNGKQEIWYIDSDGAQHTLAARPLEVITNAGLTKAAVLMPPVDAIPMDKVNTLPREKQVEYFDRLSKKEQLIWFNNDSSATLSRQYRRLEYDASGRHFMAVYTGYFEIDGKRNDVNISAAGTRFFAGKDLRSWAAYSQGYLNFNDRTYVKDAINPFITTEGGKDYINWFKVESGSNGDVIKWGKREL